MRKIYLLLFLGALTMVQCRNEELLENCPSISTNLSISASEALFLDVAFGQEFGQDAAGLRKWDQAIRLHVVGEAPSEVVQELDIVIDELNQLSDFILISKTLEPDEANFIVFLGEKVDYVGEIEPAAQGIAEGNSGFVTIAWDASSAITRASVCIDHINFPALNDLKHVIREEMAQALGLINDTEESEDSIFHQFLGDAISYSTLDQQLIAYQLGNELIPGMCPLEVLAIIE